MLTVTDSSAFRRDIKRLRKRGKEIEKLYAIVSLLVSGKPLPVRCHPHRLSGNWSPAWDCHIEPDWLLIYEIRGAELLLIGTGTHADLFT